MNDIQTKIMLILKYGSMKLAANAWFSDEAENNWTAAEIDEVTYWVFSTIEPTGEQKS